MVKRIEVLDEIPAMLEGVHFIGTATGATCYSGERQLYMQYESNLQETTGVETSTGGELNWGASVTVGASTGIEIFGMETEVSVSVTGSIGGSLSWGRTEQKSTTTGSGSTSSQYFTYTGPGSALAFGYVNVYEYNRDAVSSRFHAVCDNGARKSKDDTIKLQSKSYGMSHFGDVVYRFNEGKCNQTVLDCIRALDGAKASHDLVGLKQQYISCFANGVGQPAYRK